MNILLYNSENQHHKNKNAIEKYKNIKFTKSNDLSNIKDYDCVMSIYTPIDVSLYPNTLFLFGPQFSVFPDERLLTIKATYSFFNQLSDWTINMWKKYPITNNINFVKIPFGVETDKFKEIKPLCRRNKVFIYYKYRNIDELSFLKQFLNSKNIEYHIFDYNGYSENDYLNYLQESKYGIILDLSESQGFAIQEALSCNVPLLVWNITFNPVLDSIASSIPYWDDKCGEVFYDKNEINEKFELFISKLDNYQPRQFILDNLSMEVCEKKLIDFVNEKKNIFNIL